jgi:hypothetical protein
LYASKFCCEDISSLDSLTKTISYAKNHTPLHFLLEKICLPVICWILGFIFYSIMKWIEAFS